MKIKYQICNCCVMDTSDEYIEFDEKGVCTRCNEYKDRILPEWNYGQGHEKELSQILQEIKKSGKNKEYDCILGLSGGLDSSYMLHLAITEWGLRPYVYHIDAGWDLDVTKENIRKLTQKLGVKLHIKKLDWEEMREMQLAWFRTGLESLDVPQDHAFISVIDELSKKLGIKYILNGYNIATEIVADPSSWGKGGGPVGDGTYLKDVVKKHCKIPIKKYVFTNGFKHKFIVPYIWGVKTIKPLNLVPITLEKMQNTLSTEYGFEVYQQKHFEDIITKFLEGWWMPTRFKHDIRRAWLSSLVMTNQMSREKALEILDTLPICEEESKELFTQVAQMLEISEEELWDFHRLPESTIKYKTQEKFYNFGIRLYEKLGLEKRVRR